MTGRVHGHNQRGVNFGRRSPPIGGQFSTLNNTVVVSDDGTVDAVPLFHPKIKHSAICKALGKLESSSKDDYHESINWLAQHRFYLDKNQCDRINAALERIRQEPREVGEIQITWNEFVPNSDFDESYLEDEDAP